MATSQQVALSTILYYGITGYYSIFIAPGWGFESKSRMTQPNSKTVWIGTHDPWESRNPTSHKGKKSERCELQLVALLPWLMDADGFRFQLSAKWRIQRVLCGALFLRKKDRKGSTVGCGNKTRGHGISPTA